VSGADLPLSAVADRLRAADLLRVVRGSQEVRVAGVSQDSRAVSPGDLFLAWKGIEHDAHDFLPEAVAGGAVAAVVERFVDAVEVPQLRVSDGRRAGALAADLVHGSPGRRMALVGVTGTNGKTTTTLLIRHILAETAAAAALGTLGLVGPDGEVRPGTEGLTTPGPVEVARRLRVVADEGVEAVAIEASSHALEQGRLDALRFRVAVFTNLSRDHLDYHEDWDGYFGAKARLAELLEGDGVAVLNADEPRWRDLPTGDRRVLTFGIDESAEVRGRDLELGPSWSGFTVEDVRGGESEVRLPLLGRFNVENALAALGAAVALGRDLHDAAGRLESAPQVKGRLETVVREPFTVLIDFAHTPDALARVVETLRPLAPGRLTVVFGAGGDRDRAKRPLMGRAVAGVADRIVVTSDNPRGEDPERIIDDVVSGLEGTPYERIADREEAIARVLATAEEGEMILLAGKGHETYQVVGTEKRPFDERRIVRTLLNGAGASGATAEAPVP